jgi:hypothetical protein
MRGGEETKAAGFYIAEFSHKGKASVPLGVFTTPTCIEGCSSPWQDLNALLFEVAVNVSSRLWLCNHIMCKSCVIIVAMKTRPTCLI